MIGLIVVVVVLVASIVMAIFASRFWHWAHVMVIMALVFSTIGYSNLAYRVLAIRAKHQLAEKKANELLAQQEELIDAIDRGTESGGLVSRLSEPLGLDQDAARIVSIGDMEYQLRMVNRERGRLWDEVRPLGPPNPQSLQVDVGVAEDQPPMNIGQGAILYAFVQGDPSDGASYIGEFRVVQADARQVRLEPVLAMHPEDMQRYSASAADGSAWTLHESMPVDSHDLFAGLSEEQLRELLPEASVEEYLRHGSQPQPDDDPRRIMGHDSDGLLVGLEEIDRAVDKFYSRQLRDYAYLFQEHSQRQAELRAEGLAIQSNKQKVEETLAGAKKMLAFRQDEQRKLKKDLAGAQRDQKAAETHLVALQKQLKIAQNLLEETLAANLRTAQDLAAVQAAWAGQADLSSQPVPASAAGDPHAL